jgi:ribosomal protein S18 acetylase RimI-like enzyme
MTNTGTNTGTKLERVEVREAVATDARRLAGMRWDVEAEDGGLDPESREAWVDRHTTWFKDAVTGEWQVFVAEDGLRLCGHVFVRVVDKAPSPRPGATAIGYVTNFYVVPERRGQGIGDRLLEAMTAWADRGELDVLVVWPSDESVAHYERVGFSGGEVLQLPVSRAEAEG